jgi:hypothetical protein
VCERESEREKGVRERERVLVCVSDREFNGY